MRQAEPIIDERQRQLDLYHSFVRAAEQKRRDAANLELQAAALAKKLMFIHVVI